jgi:hypothetical protein
MHEHQQVIFSFEVLLKTKEVMGTMLYLMLWKL